MIVVGAHKTSVFVFISKRSDVIYKIGIATSILNYSELYGDFWNLCNNLRCDSEQIAPCLLRGDNSDKIVSSYCRSVIVLPCFQYETGAV